MTIIKISGDKEPYKPPEPEVGGALPPKDASCTLLDEEKIKPTSDPLAALEDDETLAAVAVSMRKAGKGRRCAGLATLLLVLSCGIITVGLITGLYLWHQTYGPGSRRGICGAAYREGEKMGLFQERVHLPDDDTELLDVPKIGHWQRSRITHAFNVRKTAIEDFDNRRCYIMDLDEKLVKPPTSVWELIIKIRRGDYFPQEEVIRRTMRIDEGPLSLDELRAFGVWIYNACESMETYTLVEVDEADRILDREPRDDDGFRRKRSPGADTSFAFYAGEGLAEINLVK